jgi:putative MATE family efflux protein
MFLTTKMVVGKLGYHSLAAVGIAGDLTFEILVILMAMLSVVGVLAAQALGAGKHHELGQSIRQGLVVATVIGGPAMIAVWNLDLALIATNQDPRVIELARGYLKGISGAVLPVLWFAIFRNFVAVLSQTVSILVITAGAVVLNYLLTLWFVHGGYGVAPLGLFGAGLATTIVSWLMFLALALHVFRKPMFRGFGIFKNRLQLIWPLCREILTLGTPVAGLAFLEAGLFVATAILSGVIGAKTLAAYEIVMAWVGIPFVIAFGLAEATMIRVAHAIGRNSMRQARRAGFLGMTLVIGLDHAGGADLLCTADHPYLHFARGPGLCRSIGNGIPLPRHRCRFHGVRRTAGDRGPRPARHEGQPGAAMDCRVRLLGPGHRWRFGAGVSVSDGRRRALVGPGGRTRARRLPAELALSSLHPAARLSIIDHHRPSCLLLWGYTPNTS